MTNFNKDPTASSQQGVQPAAPVNQPNMGANTEAVTALKTSETSQRPLGPKYSASPSSNISGTDTPAPLQASAQRASQLQIRLMGFGLVMLAIVLAYLFIVLWPSGLQASADGNSLTTVHLYRNQITFDVPLDVRLLLMVMAAGALGSFVHTATSFGDYVGNEALTANWAWWYILRPFIGMTLAVVFYLAIRGGFLSAGTDAGKINPFGIAALGGLVGMFSKQATDKLNEVFNTLFRTASGGGDAKRKDDLTNPVPSITDVEPKSIESGTDNLIVTVKGTGFVKGTVVRINGINRETNFVDPTKLTATLLSHDVESEGEVNITTFTPGPGGGLSTPIKVKIAAKSAP